MYRVVRGPLGFENHPLMPVGTEFDISGSDLITGGVTYPLGVAPDLMQATLACVLGDGRVVSV